MRDDAHHTSESDSGMRASGAPTLPDIFLLRAAERALITLGRDVNGLQVIWTTEARAILLQEEPVPALFIKVYQEGTQLEREVATMERALAAGIPVAQRLTFHPGPPAVLITKRVGGMPLTSAYPLAAEATGRLLRRFHALGARPPFVDGQRRWSVFIRNWADREIATMVARRAISLGDGQRLHRHFAARDTVLCARPCALIHADLQAEQASPEPPLHMFALTPGRRYPAAPDQASAERALAGVSGGVANGIEELAGCHYRNATASSRQMTGSNSNSWCTARVSGPMN